MQTETHHVSHDVDKVVIYYFADSPDFANQAQALRLRHLAKGRDVHFVPVTRDTKTGKTVIDDSLLPPKIFDENTKAIILGHTNEEATQDSIYGDHGEKLHIDALAENIEKNKAENAQYVRVKLMGCKAGRGKKTKEYHNGIAHKLYLALQDRNIGSIISARNEAVGIQEVDETVSLIFSSTGLFSELVLSETRCVTKTQLTKDYFTKTTKASKKSENFIQWAILNSVTLSLDEKRSLIDAIIKEHDKYVFKYCENKGAGTKVILHGSMNQSIPNVYYPYSEPDTVPESFQQRQRETAREYLEDINKKIKQIKKDYANVFKQIEEQFPDSTLFSHDCYKLAKLFFTEKSNIFGVLHIQVVLDTLSNNTTKTRAYLPEEKKIIADLLVELKKVDVTAYQKDISFINKIRFKDDAQKDIDFMNTYKRTEAPGHEEYEKYRGSSYFFAPAKSSQHHKSAKPDRSCSLMDSFSSLYSAVCA